MMRRLMMLALCGALAACGNSGGEMPDDRDTAVSDSALAAPERQDEMMPVEPDGGIGNMPGGTPPPGEGLSEKTPDKAAPPQPARVMLQSMTYAEFSGAIEPGLGCSFEEGSGKRTLLVATAPDDNRANGKGVVKLNDTLVVMQSGSKGFREMEKGGTFRTEALTVTIDRASGPGEKIGIETMTWPATMRVEQDEGGSNSYKGIYACGA